MTYTQVEKVQKVTKTVAKGIDKLSVFDINATEYN